MKNKITKLNTQFPVIQVANAAPKFELCENCGSQKVQIADHHSAKAGLDSLMQFLKAKLQDPKEKILLVFDFDGVLKDDDTGHMMGFAIPENISEKLAAINKSSQISVKLLTARSPEAFKNPLLFPGIDKYCCSGRTVGQHNEKQKYLIKPREGTEKYFEESQYIKDMLLASASLKKLTADGKIELFIGSGTFGIVVNKDITGFALDELKRDIIDEVNGFLPRRWELNTRYAEAEPHNIFFYSKELWARDDIKTKAFGINQIFQDLDFKPSTLVNFGDTNQDLAFMKEVKAWDQDKLDIRNVQVMDKITDTENTVDLKLQDHSEVYEMITSLYNLIKK